MPARPLRINAEARRPFGLRASTRRPSHGRRSFVNWRERLAFRDALRGDPELMVEHEALKIRLAEEHGTDVSAYTAGKGAFVARVLAAVGIQPGRR